MTPTKTCPHCGEAFAGDKRSGPTRKPHAWAVRRYCTHRCQRKAGIKRFHDRRKGARP